MAKVHFSKLSDDEPTDFDGSGVSSPSGYNRFSKKPLEGLESKESSVGLSIPPEGSTTPDASTGDESGVLLPPGPTEDLPPSS